MLRLQWVKTPLADMVALADEERLYQLEFVKPEKEGEMVERWRRRWKRDIKGGVSRPLCMIQEELAIYFREGKGEFTTPLLLEGSVFQLEVWRVLQRIPLGGISSYAQIAQAVGCPKAYRAVAQANRSNRLAIVIPCHRVIGKGGELRGYAGGVEKKAWLLRHEKEKRDIAEPKKT